MGRSTERGWSGVVRLLAIAALCGALVTSPLVAGGARAQTQEPRPTIAPTATGEADATPEASATGVDGNVYTSPTFGYKLTWDEAVWAVENELMLDGYNGLQLGTEISIFYLEGYEAFGGDAEQCLSDAVNEIAQRDSVANLESVNRLLPVEGDAAGESAVFLYSLSFEDGGAVDILEYVECRPLIEGRAVLEITFQTAEAAYDAELADYRDLLAGLDLSAVA